MGTTFTSSRTIVGTDTVVVETNADYVEGDETSSVSSCDLYDVVDGKIRHHLVRRGALSRTCGRSEPRRHP